MKRRNSLVFIKIFLFSVLMAAPFLIKQTFFSNIKKLEENYEEKGVEEEEQKENLDKNLDSNESQTNKDKDSNQKEPDKKPEISNKASFVMVEDNYFDDALFIGDSRTVGIQEYGKMTNATYFADTGMSIYNLHSKKISVSKVGKVTLKELLSSHKYAKIYVMLGINEIGYPIDKTVKKYKELVEYIQEVQPDAILFIQANLHVTKEKGERNPTFSNKRIDKLNNELSKMANNKTIYYLDVNPLFDDENGNLRKDYTFDNTHIYAKYYVKWKDFFKEHGIEKSINEKELF